MKKSIVAIVVMLLAAAAPVTGRAEAAGPAIQIGEMRYHAGKVVKGKQASHVFEISNAGTEILVIERVQPG